MKPQVGEIWEGKITVENLPESKPEKNCGNCEWHKPHSAGELPKHLVCRTIPVKFVPVGYPRHCAKCDRSEAACRCAFPNLISEEE